MNMFSALKDDLIIHPEQVIEWMSRVKTMSVRSLTDATFEHDTQAASGATTGDWFILL